MPPLSDHKVQEFRARLGRELEELTALRTASADRRDPVELDQQSVGRLSRVDAMQDQQMALAADRRRQLQIERIRRALDEIEKGEFGYCAGCGNEIPKARLEVDPAAHLCVTCAR